MSFMAFDRDRRNSGRSFGRRDQGGGHSFDRPREMTKVTCSNCGKETEVPFKPTGDRPVYCRECFAKMGGRDRRDNRDSRPPFRKLDDNRTRGPGNNVELSEINAKLDTLIKLLSPKPEEKIHSADRSGQLSVELPAKKKVVAKKAVKEKKITKAKIAVKKSPEAPVEIPSEEL